MYHIVFICFETTVCITLSLYVLKQLYSCFITCSPSCIGRSLRPTNSGDTSLGKTSNRTYKESVCNSCEDYNFHKKLYTAPTNAFVPPWVLTKAECIEADRRMHFIIGPPRTTRIKHVMKAGKGDNTHDTLEWAFTYARWCWRGLGTRIYMDNNLDIFDLLNILTASTMKIETVCMMHSHMIRFIAIILFVFMFGYI